MTNMEPVAFPEPSPRARSSKADALTLQDILRGSSHALTIFKLEAVAKPKSKKWAHTVERLKKLWEITDRATRSGGPTPWAPPKGRDFNWNMRCRHEPVVT